MSVIYAHHWNGKKCFGGRIEIRFKTSYKFQNLHDGNVQTQCSYSKDTQIKPLRFFQNHAKISSLEKPDSQTENK